VLLAGRWKPAAGVAILVLAAAAALLLSRRPVTPGMMLACLPGAEAPVLYVDVALMRRTGLLERIAGDAKLEEADYRNFVAATGFNYRQDLDGALLAFTGEARFFVLAGRFDEARLSSYAASNGGRCVDGFCTMQGSTPDHLISFRMLRPGLLGLAVSTNPQAAAALTNSEGKPWLTPPDAALWFALPGTALPFALPLSAGESELLSALEGADRAVFQAAPSGNGLQILMEAYCSDPATSARIVARLSDSTNALKRLAERAGVRTQDDRILTALASGVFRAERQTAHGAWTLTLPTTGPRP
jgi:hypothetical protein